MDFWVDFYERVLGFAQVQHFSDEQVSTELIGPPTTAFVDSTNCRVMNP